MAELGKRNKYTQKRERLTRRKIGKGRLTSSQTPIWVCEQMFAASTRKEAWGHIFGPNIHGGVGLNRTINLPVLIIKRMTRAADQERGTYTLSYGFLLTRVFAHFKIPLKRPKKGTKKYIFDEKTLRECDCIGWAPGIKSKNMAKNLLEELVVSMRRNRS